ncbi:hypothetical protein C8Q78DRAFT_746368 [Trametes maxima]|nr:hypothetical protein C8Q78DRAFT_746368 [Trametes maxima]
MQLYEQDHPQHIETVYRMPIDTASDVTWFYGHNFKKILDPGRRDHPIPWTEHDQHTTQVTKRRFIVPVERRAGDNQFILVPFATDVAPTTPDEQLIRYKDGCAIYVRQMPTECDLSTIYECWSWKDSKNSTSGKLRLPCLLAYGANTLIVNQPFDGNIGLSVPRESSLKYGEDGSALIRNFFDALEWPEQAVEEPRRFLIKFTHPDHLVAALRNKAKDFLYFGNKFPCALKPRFTPRIMVYKSKATSDDVKAFAYRYWTVNMQSMSLIVPGEPLDENPGYTIDFASYVKQLNPQKTKEPQETKDPQESKTSETAKEPRGIYVTFDTGNETFTVSDQRLIIADDLGSASTYLPPTAVETISKVWLKNSSDVQPKPTLNRTLPYHPSNPYVGQERNLDNCDVLFKFIGLDGKPVEFRCAAKLFFKLPWPVGGSGTSEGMFQSGIRSDTTQDVDANSTYIFGINFFWAAFVEHCGPMLDLVHDETETKPAYIRLAPQRAKKPNGDMGGPEAFSLFSRLPPKYFVEPEES